jgi:pSer/pThr/pTyr-binding forkhead associated (FHA) protein
MDCTLKIIAGPETGREFVCAGPETYLGRSQRCAVRLGSPSVSFEHAVITRAGDEFYVENLSANGTVLNNERLLSRTRLRVKDQIRLGSETVARVESLPLAAAAGSGRRILLAGLVGLLILAAALVVSRESSQSTDVSARYRAMQEYVQEQAAAGGLPTDVPALLAEAWRKETTGTRAEATQAWLTLELRLDAWDRTQPPDDERAALMRFVKEMERGR